ncbi:MAG: HAMP domain-containing sensor histidine kinase, partial [Gammaproteobacteria bacterium]|nr:HAMP domain-containing sensor histidine kinase [Gammaproteobacteria bacterium]
TAIKGSIDLLDIAPEEKKKQLLEMLKRNTERLVLLINDLLDMDKIISGNINFNYQDYPIKDLIPQIIDDNQGYAREQSTRIVLKGDLPAGIIHVDKTRFNQIMANLISNACKFTADGTDVEINVTEKNHVIVFNVTDHGAGIPESFQSRLFERFTQTDSTTTRAVGGTGLGLYITRQLVEAMHGEITFESQLEVGTTFSVSFKAM